ncbi:MAG: hypothetical protein ACAI44_27130 [Candidatus Sericytochromatia bacterium]
MKALSRLLLMCLAGCAPASQPTPQPTPSPTPTAAITMSFATKVCNQTLTVAQTAEGGIQQTWLADGLQITASASANCAVKILSGRFELRGKQLKLFYTAEACGVAGAPQCVRCMCDHPVTYTLHNLPKADYQISLEQDQPK